MAIPLLLFSGGLDSTVMLQKQLDVGACDVLYGSSNQHPTKIILEREARTKIIDHFNATRMHKVHGEWDNANPINITHEGTKWAQPIAWMTAALAALDPNRHSELQIGYVANDGSFCRHLPDMEEIWLRMQKIAKWGTPVPLKFPIIDYSKVDLLNELDLRLLDSLWICEQPTDEHVYCGKCKPCTLMKESLARFKTNMGITVFTKRLQDARELKARLASEPEYGNAYKAVNLVRTHCKY
jgi:7-cyano-7-deazaguanine synthase in queuosine biosynthesis